MATVNGNSVSHWHGYLTHTETLHGTTVDLKAVAGFQAESWGFSIGGGITATATADGTSKSAHGGFSCATGASTKKDFATVTKTVKRGHTDHKVTLSAKVVNASGYLNGTSTASATYTVPKLDSWTVAYDANGGAGAPSAQTKWRGEALSLSKSKPTRDNHTFMGWATSQGGPVAYQPGGSYAANAAATLYAVWRLDYVPPTLTGLTVTRCDDDGAESDTGTQARVAFSWTVDAASAQAVKALTVATSKRGSGAWATTTLATPSGTSGKVSELLAGPFSTDSAYDVRVTITDASDGSASATATMATAFFVLDVTADGHGMGVGCVAPASGLSVAMDTDLTGALTVGGILSTTAMSHANLHAEPVYSGVTWDFREINLSVTRGIAVMRVDVHVKTGTVKRWGNILPASIIEAMETWAKPPADGVQIRSASGTGGWVASLNSGGNGKYYLWPTAADVSAGSGLTDTFMWPVDYGR